MKAVGIYLSCGPLHLVTNDGKISIIISSVVLFHARLQYSSLVHAQGAVQLGALVVYFSWSRHQAVIAQFMTPSSLPINMLDR